MKRSMIKIMLPILLLCILACLYIAVPYDNTSNDETITISTLDEGSAQKSMLYTGMESRNPLT